ncbi:MAG: hypothetical protein GEU88_07555 [Solirubrobacterales bacterium]|nr:hypothetical protein [Solirubrobacterales bacterium]
MGSWRPGPIKSEGGSVPSRLQRIHEDGAQAAMKAIIYAAKSTADQRGSIPAQLRDGRQLAEREGWTVMGEYHDEAASAWSGDRGPGLSAAMEHAERIGASLVVQHSDRLARGDGRSARHLGEIYFWAIKHGVVLRSVQDDSTFTNPLLAFAMGERNAEDSRRKSLAVKAGKARRAALGLALGGPRPYGYRWENGDLVIVREEAEIVRRIYAETLQGRSQLAIARDLNREGIHTAQGRRWQHRAVATVLSNAIYRGQVTHQGQTFQGRHKAIVDDESWAKVSDLRDARRRTHKRGRGPAGSHLFRKGMLRCAECGEAMLPRTDRGTVETYRCFGRYLDPESCSMLPVRRELVDDAVFRYFARVGLDVEATRSALADARDRKLSEIRALRDGAERDVRTSQERLARVRRDYTDGAIAAADWAEFRRELEPELAAAEAKLGQIERQHDDVSRWAEVADAEEETYRQLAEIRAAIAGEVQGANGVEAVRAVLARMFDHFRLHLADGGPVHLELLAAEVWIEPVIADRAIEGYGQRMRPVLRREPLNRAENNWGEAKVNRCLAEGRAALKARRAPAAAGRRAP